MAIVRDVDCVNDAALASWSWSVSCESQKAKKVTPAALM